MNGNDFMAWVLRSPLHGMLSGNTLLITFMGRKTGRKYTTPVNYYGEGEYLWVVSSRDRTWWRNLQGGVQVDLLLKRKSVQAFAETEMDEKAVELRMQDYLRRFPMAAKPMGVRVENGIANPQDIAAAARERLFVRIRI